jgi:hypothetical protein
MRDPATIDPEVEAAIEDTRQFLEPYVQSESWKADPAPKGADALFKFEIQGKLEPAVESIVLSALREQLKRKTKPTRNYRDTAIQIAAARLVSQGYERSRNDEMRHTESASSIICQALRRLGEKKIKERTIKDIVLVFDRKAYTLIDAFRVRKFPP